MIIGDMRENYIVHSIEELESILVKRWDGGVNCFWLAESMSSYPRLALLVKDDLATLNYYPDELIAGYRSVGTNAQHEPTAVSTFPISSHGDQIQVLNDAIISFPLALEAAKQFFSTHQLPPAIRWLEL